jgi:drug/metabolite transporter (DMT)-like permease
MIPAFCGRGHGGGHALQSRRPCCRPASSPASSARSFGGGDFAGASAARRAGALLAVAGAHSIGLIALLVGLAVVRPPLPGADAIAIAAAAGVAGMVGLAALYRGMAVGSMGIVTAVAGAGSLVLPLAVGALRGQPVGPLQLVGVACAAAAAAAASGALAGLAALAFGAWYVLIDLAASAGDSLWALVFSRAASAGIATVVVVAHGIERSSIPWALLVAAALLDVGGNIFFVLARDAIPIGLAAAIVGLYPVVTMLLARFVIGERLPAVGLVGVALALLGIVLISAGG